MKDNHAFDTEAINERIRQLEEMKEVAIGFANYILNEQAMKDMSGHYLIAGVGVFTPDELFDKFLQEKYK